LFRPIIRLPHFACEVLGAPLGTKVPKGDCSALIATVAPPGASGTVQFTDRLENKTTVLGDPMQVRPGGLAVLITKRLTRGAHSLTAMFIPKDPAAFKPSTSNTVRIEIGDDR
jgi:hypothetical protein